VGYHYAGAYARLVDVHVQRLPAKIEIDHEHPLVVITVRVVATRPAIPLSCRQMNPVSPRLPDGQVTVTADQMPPVR
jgi:hypothetical protein